MVSLRKRHSSIQGFTLIELMVVLAIVAVLALLALFGAPKFIARANDARRKSDLKSLKIAFESYYADKKCYPDADVLAAANCGASIPELSAYVKKIPCDPVTGQPYAYFPTDCTSFILYTRLDDKTDRDIAKQGCAAGCGADTNGDGSGDYDYQIATDNVTVGADGDTTIPPQNGASCFPNQCGGCSIGYMCVPAGDACRPIREGEEC